MSLKQIFNDRVRRAASMLESPKMGPKKINFSSADLSNPSALARIHSQFPNKKPRVIYLYQLSFDGNEMSFISEARSVFRSARAAGKLNMSRDNADHPDSNSLYVGTSESMYDRFRTHLGRGKGTTTWALYLSAWATPLLARFEVEYYEFKGASVEDVELIEGVLWDSLRPLFGKKGGK